MKIFDIFMREREVKHVCIFMKVVDIQVKYVRRELNYELNFHNIQGCLPGQQIFLFATAIMV